MTNRTGEATRENIVRGDDWASPSLLESVEDVDTQEYPRGLGAEQ